MHRGRRWHRYLGVSVPIAATIGGLATGPSLPFVRAAGRLSGASIAVAIVALTTAVACLVRASAAPAAARRTAWRWLAVVSVAIAGAAACRLLDRRAAATTPSALLDAGATLALLTAVGADGARRNLRRAHAADAAIWMLAAVAAGAAWWAPAAVSHPDVVLGAAAAGLGAMGTTIVVVLRRWRRGLVTRTTGALLAVVGLARAGVHVAWIGPVAGHPVVPQWASLLGDAVAVAALGAITAVAGAPRSPDRQYRRRPRPHRLAELLPPVAITAALLVACALVPPRREARVFVAVVAVVTTALCAARVARTVAAGERRHGRVHVDATVDPLTGLSRRDQVKQRLAGAARTEGRASAVVVVDVDRFQHVNDTRGHRFGDAVLCELATRLRAAAPAAAVIGRTGGDEFTIAVPEVTDEHDALRLADRLLAAIARPMRVDGDEVFLSATAGIATNLRAPAGGTDELFREADTALHRAKRGARGGVTVFDAAMRIAVERRVEIETQLRAAIDRGELTMHYQPVVDIRAGTVIGFEALMRWAHPSGRLVGPTAFIEVAEETGLVVPMGAWALVESLCQLRRWIDAGTCDRHATMSVNVAALQLRDPGLVACVMGALAGTALPPHQLTLEITETALLGDAAQVERTIDQLVSLGVRLALDDFGTGYSSLAHLRRFPIDRIKIDRSFVRSLQTSAADRALVRSIVAMARELGKDVVVEGVETHEQLAALTSIGCAQAQGFLFSAALPAASIGECVAVLERAGG